MATRKKNLHDSKNADTCPCACCKWNSSRAIQGVLTIMFILIVAALAASLIWSSNAYFGASVLSFMGVIFLIIFVGIVIGVFCSCRGIHWSRHGYDWLDTAALTARRRYASGEISKKEYDKIVKDIQ